MPSYLEPLPLRQQVTAACRSYFGAGLTELVALPGGASVRHYHRAYTDGSPSTFLVMELGEPAQFSDEATSGKVEELPFISVQRYLASGGLPVPEIFGYDEPSQLLYLENFGDITFESQVVGASPAQMQDLYRRAILQLLKLQRFSRETPDRSCIAFGRKFDYALLKWELDHFVEFGLDAVHSGLTAAERATLEANFSAIAEELAAAPQLFVHRDYQSRNLMVLPDGRLGILDFQDALLGNQAYDLVGLLRDSYVVLPAQLFAELTDFFIEQARPGADFSRLFALQIVQRKLKDAGRFVFIDRKKQNPSFLRHIPSSLDYVLLALQELQGFAAVNEILERRTAALRALGQRLS